MCSAIFHLSAIYNHILSYNTWTQYSYQSQTWGLFGILRDKCGIYHGVPIFISWIYEWCMTWHLERLIFANIDSAGYDNNTIAVLGTNHVIYDVTVHWRDRTVNGARAGKVNEIDLNTLLFFGKISCKTIQSNSHRRFLKHKLITFSNISPYSRMTCTKTHFRNDIKHRNEPV